MIGPVVIAEHHHKRRCVTAGLAARWVCRHGLRATARHRSAASRTDQCGAKANRPQQEFTPRGLRAADHSISYSARNCAIGTEVSRGAYSPMNRSARLADGTFDAANRNLGLGRMLR